jgi:hypothetical protein
MTTFAMVRKDLFDRCVVIPTSKGVLPSQFMDSVFLVVRDASIEDDEFNTKIRVHRSTFKVVGIDFEYFQSRKEAYQKRGETT